MCKRELEGCDSRIRPVRGQFDASRVDPKTGGSARSNDATRCSTENRRRRRIESCRSTPATYLRRVRPTLNSKPSSRSACATMTSRSLHCAPMCARAGATEQVRSMQPTRTNIDVCTNARRLRRHRNPVALATQIARTARQARAAPRSQSTARAADYVGNGPSQILRIQREACEP